ncbi:hypothetical protein HDU93_000126 [Gonapodya sp. JEL0774]|nr:hypothetical protein HDU93_000126 [Gonapodya sp. JEL0774]
MNFLSQLFGSGPLSTLPGPIPTKVTETTLREVLKLRAEGNDVQYLENPVHLYAILLANRSLAYRKQRMWDEAERDAEGCLESQPTWPKSHLRLAEVLLDRRRFAPASDSLGRAVQLATQPGSRETQATLVKLLERKGFADVMAEGERAGVIVWQVRPGRDADARSKESVVVDPCWDADGIVKCAMEQGWKVVGVAVTHAHFDHVGGKPPPPFDRYPIQVSGLHAVLRKFPQIAFYMNPNDTPLLLQSNPDIPLTRLKPTADDTKITLPIAPTPSNPAHVEMKFIHTPGHTAGSQCISVSALDDPTFPPRLLTGDTLFIGSCGRTDMPESDMREMHVSLTQKLARLGDRCVAVAFLTLWGGGSEEPTSTSNPKMTRETYPAVTLRGIRDLTLEQLEIPTLKDGEVLVRMKACGICGSDLHFWKGEMAVTFPCPMGHEGSGVVEELGPGDMNGIQIGDRVAVMPSSFQHMTLLARYSVQYAKSLYKLPDHVSFEEAAYVEPLAVSLHAVKRGGISPDAAEPQSVFIIGAGPIGQNAVLCAKARGAGWIGVLDIRQDRLYAAKSVSRLSLIAAPSTFLRTYRAIRSRIATLQIGADATVQPVVEADKEKEKAAALVPGPSESIKGTVGRAMALLPAGKVVDVVVDCVGSSDTLNTAIALVKPFGVVVNVGIGHFRPTGIDMLTMAVKQVSLQAVFAYPTEFPEALELIASGAVDVKPLITHLLPLEDFEKGYNAALESKEGSVKVMFKI